MVQGDDQEETSDKRICIVVKSNLHLFHIIMINGDFRQPLTGEQVDVVRNLQMKHKNQPTIRFHKECKK